MYSWPLTQVWTTWVQVYKDSLDKWIHRSAYRDFFSVVNTTVPHCGWFNWCPTSNGQAQSKVTTGRRSLIKDYWKKKGVKKKLAQIVWDIKLYFLLLKRYSEATRIDFFFFGRTSRLSLKGSTIKSKDNWFYWVLIHL